jgi:hypothetical protein
MTLEQRFDLPGLRLIGVLNRLFPRSRLNARLAPRRNLTEILLHHPCVFPPEPVIRADIVKGGHSRAHQSTNPYPTANPTIP